MVGDSFRMTLLYADTPSALAGFGRILTSLTPVGPHAEPKVRPTRGGSGTADLTMEFPDGRKEGFPLWHSGEGVTLYRGVSAVSLYPLIDPLTKTWLDEILSESPSKQENETFLYDLFKRLWVASGAHVGYIDEEPVPGYANRVWGVGPGRGASVKPQATGIGEFNLANVFCRAYVKEFGRERLMTAGALAFLVEELEDGSVFIVPQSLTARPFNRESKLYDPDFLLMHLVP